MEQHTRLKERRVEQVVDFHDESLVWLLPYREMQDLGISFGDRPDARAREEMD